MNLLGDVGKMEIRREGSRQENDRFQVLDCEQRLELARLGLVGSISQSLGKRSHLFDEVEQPGTYLADQGLTEQVPQQPDIGTKRGIVVEQVDWIKGHGGERTLNDSSVTAPESPQHGALVHCR